MRHVLIPDLSPQTLPFVPPKSWRAHRLAGSALGTDWTLRAYAPPQIRARQIQEAVELALSRAVMLFSQWEPHSELSRLNADPQSEIELSPNFASFLHKALAISRLTGGAYDPTLGALVDLWGFGASGPRAPSAGPPRQSEVLAALATAGAGKLALDAPRRRLRRPFGLCFDFCGSAKGWAADEISANLTEIGALSHLIELGGEISARGLKPDMTPWWIDLEEEDAAQPALRIALCDGALASSGDWRRKTCTRDGAFGHTLDPATGYPVSGGPNAVSVLAADAATADALATALMTMAQPQAEAFCAAHKIAAVLVHRTKTGTERHLTQAAQRRIA